MSSRTLRSIAEQYSVPAKFLNDEGYSRSAATWDGVQFHVPFMSDRTVREDELAAKTRRETSCDWLYHEIAHYLFAPVHAREFENFGLGTDPGNLVVPSKEVPTAWRGERANQDEDAVCVLGVLLMAEDEIPRDVILHHMREYFIEDVRRNNLVLLTQAGFVEDRVLKGVADLLESRLLLED